MHATIKVLLKTVFSTRSVQRGYKEDNWGNRDSSVWEAVKKRESWKGYRKGAVIQRGLEHGSRGIAVVRNRYQGTSSEDTAGWKRFSMCCSDL
jgi:hypothetical protein